MARKKMLIGAVATVSALTLAASAVPAQVARSSSGASHARTAVALTGGSAPSLTETETNEQIVADFLRRKERAEKAQRAILGELRKDLDRRRAEFDEARKRFDEARARYSEIVGPLPRQGVMNPADPRLPYEFEVRRLWPNSPDESKAGQLSQQPQPRSDGGLTR
ncbi:MAG: hypothetical protein AB7I30_20685 [Isosphaeraceae bacterium]